MSPFQAPPKPKEASAVSRANAGQSTALQLRVEISRISLEMINDFDGQNLPLIRLGLCQPVPICANLCQSVPTCANLCQSVPICVNLCQSVPICANLCQSVPICANLCQPVPICANPPTTLPSYHQLTSPHHPAILPPAHDPHHPPPTPPPPPPPPPPGLSDINTNLNGPIAPSLGLNGLASSKIFAEFYNPSVVMWESLIEPWPSSLDMTVGEQMDFAFESDHPFNVNLSTEFLTVSGQRARNN